MVKLSASAGGGGDYEYWVVRNDKLIKNHIIKSDSLITPEADAYRTLELVGLGADTYTTNGQFGEKERRALVIRVLDQDSPNYKEMFRTSVTYTETPRGLGPKTMIGQLFTAIHGGEYPDDADTGTDEFWLTIIGGRFQAMLSVSDDGQFTNLVKDTIKACRRATPAKASKKSDDNELTAEDEEAA